MRTEDNGVLIYEVSEFIQHLNETLLAIVDGTRIAIEGEVSSFSISQQKWVRFDLKDSEGLINCFLVIHQLRVPLEDGMKIRVHGYPKIYPKYGKFSLVVQRIELVGEGALLRAYELLKKKLGAEGFFTPERKRPIPRFPERIGLIGSRESAACGDFLRILNNRWNGVQVDLASVQVQGEPAIRQIVGAFRYFQTAKQKPDVLVLTRGGGSLDELGAFNSEEVARAIFSSTIPVIVGVGHERDETIADFVADLRASTPTNAAELAVPDRSEILYALSSSARHIEQALLGVTQNYDRVLHHATTRLQRHVEKILHQTDRIILTFSANFRQYYLQTISFARDLQRYTSRLFVDTTRWQQHLREVLTAQERLMKTLDPKAVLSRGYAIVFDTKHHVIKAPGQVDTGTALTVQLSKGILPVVVAAKKYGQDALPL